MFNRGFMLGGFTMQFPAYRSDVAATFFAMGGPFALPVGLFEALSGAPYMWRGYTCQQRWDAWDYKSLGHDWFVRRDGNLDCMNFTPSVAGKQDK